MKQLSAECHRLREEGEGRAADLERELRTREEHHHKELDRLTAKSGEQEAHAEGKKGRPCASICSILGNVVSTIALTLELEEERQSHGNELNQLREQLATATSEQQRLRTELEGQLGLVTKICYAYKAFSLSLL